MCFAKDLLIVSRRTGTDL